MQPDLRHRMRPPLAESMPPDRDSLVSRVWWDAA